MLVLHKGHESARAFFNSSTASSYDSIVKTTTFGRDVAWKRRIIEEIRPSKKVLDLACGTGILAAMVDSENNGRVVGLDLTIEYLQMARKKMHLASVQATAEAIPYRDEIFDAVVSSYLPKYVDPQALASECWRVLAPGGIAVFHDFTCPQNSTMRCIWTLYFKVLRIAGVFARPWSNVFCNLDRVICESRWTSKLGQALQDRGFERIECMRYTLGTAAIVVARKNL